MKLELKENMYIRTDRKLEDYNLENCTYDYALVILGRLQELKGSDSNVKD